MCIAISRECDCGTGVASLHHANSVLPDEVITAVYCPDCESKVEFDPSRMLRDNGWIIEYDMDLAAGILAREGLDPDSVTPELIFDKGYSTWNGLTPTDAFDKSMEMHELLSDSKGDKLAYFQAMKKWTQERTTRLAEQGWRKARLAL